VVFLISSSGGYINGESGKNKTSISLISNCNNFIKPTDLKPKYIQKIPNPNVLPKVKIIWENEYDSEINWGNLRKFGKKP